MANLKTIHCHIYDVKGRERYLFSSPVLGGLLGVVRLRGLPCFAEGIYWATGLSLTTPFTEGRLAVNNKASPPGRHQEQAPKQRCTFSPTTFSSVQFSARNTPVKVPCPSAYLSQFEASL